MGIFSKLIGIIYLLKREFYLFIYLLKKEFYLFIYLFPENIYITLLYIYI